MPPVTPKRIRLSLAEKAKIIEDSKKPGFYKKQIEEIYGISRPAILNILKNQNEILKAFDSGDMNNKCKSLKIENNKNSCSNPLIVF